jgi:hypothetical protein
MSLIWPTDTWRQPVHPPLDVVRKELETMRREMASAAWDEHLDYLYELERNLKRDLNYERVSRLTSVAVFTAKQLLIAERMIKEHGETDSKVRD